MKVHTLTSKDNYFEDFEVGQTIRHMRGKTVTEMDNVLLTNLTMNSAQAHFNEHFMESLDFGQRVTFGGVTASLVVGLTAQDTAENALAELEFTAMRLKVPVFHGDTLYALTQVIEKEDCPDNKDAGIITFKHWGINQNDKVVFSCQRKVLIKRAKHWRN